MSSCRRSPTKTSSGEVEERMEEKGQTKSTSKQDRERR
jgi:hypothetical protein